MIRLNKVSKEYPRTGLALNDVTLHIAKGEFAFLTGPSGSGKSTLLKTIAGLHKPTSGRVLVRRGITVGTMIELGVGFHPELTGRENVYLSASIYGLSRAEVDVRVLIES